MRPGQPEVPRIGRYLPKDCGRTQACEVPDEVDHNSPDGSEGIQKRQHDADAEGSALRRVHHWPGTQKGRSSQGHTYSERDDDEVQ